MVVLHQLKLSIEEAHGPNNGHAEGGGENNFVEHLFLLVYDLGLGHTARFCSSWYKSAWSDNRPPRGAGSDPLHCSRFQRKSTSKPAGKALGIDPLQRNGITPVHVSPLSELCLPGCRADPRDPPNRRSRFRP